MRDGVIVGVVIADKVQRVQDIVTTIPALLFQPAEARDFYTNDDASPRLALQLYNESLEDLEAAIAADGALQPLTDADIWRMLGPVKITRQVMYARPYPVLDTT
ncbi:hypothetical protein [Oricola nitratireducens]|uniref:hypothetical protein n=1 Tax=Oricola nitratireducens TaxID=2775868 RepID=UPI00186773DB|nr:hypothetical protein [Oricola nitratireducens]